MSSFLMDNMTRKELKSFIDKLQFERIVSDEDNINDDGASMLIESCYSIGARFGATDYQDHRKDSLNELKTLIMPNLTEPRQRINYYKEKGKLYSTIGVVGYFGGYSAYFID